MKGVAWLPMLIITIILAFIATFLSNIFGFTIKEEAEKSLKNLKIIASINKFENFKRETLLALRSSLYSSIYDLLKIGGGQGKNYWLNEDGINTPNLIQIKQDIEEPISEKFKDILIKIERIEKKDVYNENELEVEDLEIRIEENLIDLKYVDPMLIKLKEEDVSLKDSERPLSKEIFSQFLLIINISKKVFVEENRIKDIGEKALSSLPENCYKLKDGGCKDPKEVKGCEDYEIKIERSAIEGLNDLENGLNEEFDSLKFILTENLIDAGFDLNSCSYFIEMDENIKVKDMSRWYLVDDELKRLTLNFRVYLEANKLIE